MKTTAAVLMLTLGAALPPGGPAVADEAAAGRYLQTIKDKPPFLRAFLQAMPKGGDLHSHLGGAVYAERYLEWAAADGLCVDMAVPAILPVDQAEPCTGGERMRAKKVLDDDGLAGRLIDALSMRSFVPFAGWSGHDQFFATFLRMARKPERLGNMIARTADRAGRQNVQYLELMVTLERDKILVLTKDMDWSGAVMPAYKALMNGAFGAALTKLVANARSTLNKADKARAKILKCGKPQPQPGCDVEVRYLYQVIRSMPPNAVFAQIVLGFALTKADPRVVGLNLVAPEDGRVALADYTTHMRMIDHLWHTMGPIDITLHAGELTLGLVPPEYLRFHIREAIVLGHAKRIGHGIDIAYENDSPGLLRRMAEDNILVEINLTSNAVILGVSGAAHPLALYRTAGVPVALSTDDEGVSRIDLTHEFQRAVEDQGFGYGELKQVAFNSIAYGFLPGHGLWKNGQRTGPCAGQNPVNTTDAACQAFLNANDKARMEGLLLARFADFEVNIGRWIRP